MYHRVFLLLTLLSLTYSCTKEESPEVVATTQTTEPKASYFENTNEEWFIHGAFRYGTSSSLEEYFLLRKIQDTTVVFLLDTFNAAVVTEHYHIGSDYPGLENLEYSGTYTLFYDPDLRLLRRVWSTVVYIDFKKLDFYLNVNQECTQNQINKSDNIELGNKIYNRYINSGGQEIIEGISLRVENCSLYPIGDFFSTDFTLLEMRYSCDEFSWNWTKP